MQRLRAWIRSFFGFSRTESNAFLILIPLMVVIIFSEPVYEAWFVRQSTNSAMESHRLDSLITSWKWEEADSIKKETARNFFAFNPNTATKDELLLLGFTEPLTNRILNYRAKKGVFRKKQDLLKMFGMDTAHYHQLERYIQIPEPKRDSVINFSKAELKPKEKSDLNLADSAALIKIFGIGPKLSARIVKYRANLGGFVSTDQLSEVYGLDSTVIDKIKERFQIGLDFVPTKINVNTASEKELSSHPYVGYKLAKVLVTYRFQHGAFKNEDDLRQIKLIDEQKLLKLKPYLTY